MRLVLLLFLIEQRDQELIYSMRKPHTKARDEKFQ